MRIGDAAVRRARADAIADMAALAAVTGGDEGAEAVTGAAGASIRAIRRVGSTVGVRVAADGATAEAAARPAGG
ncbi:hypothetical protein [Dermatobacter hominis]|uniref:hypothetical protein n=1 Tax=Dermatobacter hominis TaxID=2884263 RepID=UPI001D0F516F|nr:hypothetical protein [Dermatobacter hominis]UDY34338.1 hypothetical protein LH044_13435 [Dermatobacter hominis]